MRIRENDPILQKSIEGMAKRVNDLIAAGDYDHAVTVLNNMMTTIKFGDPILTWVYIEGTRLFCENKFHEIQKLMSEENADCHAEDTHDMIDIIPKTAMLSAPILKIPQQERA